MKYPLLSLSVIFAVSLTAAPAQSPPAEAFRVLPPPGKDAPKITGYLKYQTELAWEQDDQRRKRWEAIRSERELLELQEQIRQRLLAMIGGLPANKTPLRARLVGRVAMR